MTSSGATRRPESEEAGRSGRGSTAHIQKRLYGSLRTYDTFDSLHGFERALSEVRRCAGSCVGDKARAGARDGRRADTGKQGRVSARQDTGEGLFETSSS